MTEPKLAPSQNVMSCFVTIKTQMELYGVRGTHSEYVI